MQEAVRFRGLKMLSLQRREFENVFFFFCFVLKVLCAWLPSSPLLQERGEGREAGLQPITYSAGRALTTQQRHPLAPHIDFFFSFLINCWSSVVATVVQSPLFPPLIPVSLTLSAINVKFTVQNASGTQDIDSVGVKKKKDSIII